VIDVPCHTPAVTLPPTLRSVPTNNFFAVDIPPAVVIVPPFVALVASVVLLIPRPPESRTAPVELDVLVVVSSRITLPFVASDVLLIVRFPFGELLPLIIDDTIPPVPKILATSREVLESIAE
jgi:hypothetical protein